MLARRRMVRDFAPTPVPADVVDRVLDAGRRAPSAGHSQGVALVVLEGPAQTARYWDATLAPAARATFRWPGLLRAPVLAVVLADAQAYLDRYAEPDKARTGLGAGVEAWPVPYWTVDASFAAMLVLMAAVDEGLGALFFGIFHGRDELLAELGVPGGREPIGTIALGYPGPGDGRGGSALTRPRRSRSEVIRRGRW